MGWVCIIDECEGHIVDGVWDKTGLAFFSISDEITIIHDKLFEYLMTITPTAYMFGIIMLIITMIISILVTIKKKMITDGI